MIRIPDSERHKAFIVNRVDGIIVHYGDPHCPTCKIGGTERPWFTSWFIDDVTCKRCRKALSL